MVERAAGRRRRGPQGGRALGADRPATGPAGARRRWRMPRWLKIVGGAVALGLAAYGVLWCDVPLRRTLAETVLTSQHHKWAFLLGTPAELRAWQAQWSHTPDLKVVTSAVPSHVAAPVTVTPLTGPTYRGWLLSVPDPSRIIVGTSKYLGSYGERPSQMGDRLGAVAAVNGGGFMDPNGEGYGGAPIGVTMSEGRVVPADPDDGSDYVIGFDLHDRLVAGKWTIAQAQALGIRDAVSFKPLLIVGGQPLITEGDGGWGVGPRTAIGQKADGTVLFLVIDGRQAGSLGATLREVQDILLGEGAVTAANLDGGSSTVLWKDGQVLNHPSSPYGERPVPTAFLVMPPGFDADGVARPNLRSQAQVPAKPGPIAPSHSASTPGPCPSGASEQGPSPPGAGATTASGVSGQGRASAATSAASSGAARSSSTSSETSTSGRSASSGAGSLPCGAASPTHTPSTTGAAGAAASAAPAPGPSPASSAASGTSRSPAGSSR